MTASRKRFGRLTPRTAAALLVAALAGWFGGAFALAALARIYPEPRAEDAQYLQAAIVGLALPGHGWVVFLLLVLSACLAYAVLTTLDRRTLLWSAAAGALVGVAFGGSVIEHFFNQGDRGAVLGVPVGIACGMLFHRLRAR